MSTVSQSLDYLSDLSSMSHCTYCRIKYHSNIALSFAIDCLPCPQCTRS